MKISDLIVFLTNRITYLTQQKSQAETRGEVSEVIKLENEITETNATLDALRAIE